MIKGREEQPFSEQTKDWTGAIENYRLTKIDGLIDLIVSVDIT